MNDVGKEALHAKQEGGEGHSRSSFKSGKNDSVSSKQDKQAETSDKQDSSRQDADVESTSKPSEATSSSKPSQIDKDKRRSTLNVPTSVHQSKPESTGDKNSKIVYRAFSPNICLSPNCPEALSRTASEG